MRIHILLPLVAVLFNVGCKCVTTECPSECERSSTLVVLNARGCIIRPGSIYVLETNRITEVINLLSSDTGFNADGWMETTDWDRSSPCLLGRMRYQKQCIWSSGFADAFVGTGHEISTRIQDPFDCLEILNRPTTGFDYNRSAEIRLAEFRSSLSRIIYENRGCKETKVALCIGVNVLNTDKIFVKGRFSLSESKLIFEQFLKGSKLSDGVPIYSYVPKKDRFVVASIPVNSPIITRATFMVLTVVDGAIEPRIEFQFGSEFDVLGLPPI